MPEEKLVRFSAKLFNCTPAQLPSDLKVRVHRGCRGGLRNALPQRVSPQRYSRQAPN